MQPTTLRLPDELVDHIERMADEKGYSSRSEYLRVVLREHVKTVETGNGDERESQASGIAGLDERVRQLEERASDRQTTDSHELRRAYQERPTQDRTESTERDTRDDRMSPEEAFALLGNEPRIAIIRALWGTSQMRLSFSELRDCAQIADSGQFNYHLGKLTGTFVLHEEGKYGLTYAGRRVVGAILDGTYTKRASLAPFDIGVVCPACGSSVEARYEHEAFHVHCPDCDGMISQFDFPPGALDDRTREELIEMAAHWVRAQFLLIANEICPNCAGVMTCSLTTDVEYRDQEAGLEYDCERCMERATSTVGAYLIYNPLVISFYYDHGIDFYEEGWDTRVWISDQSTTVLSKEPYRISVSIPVESEILEVIVDEDLRVVEHHRL